MNLTKKTINGQNMHFLVFSLYFLLNPWLSTGGGHFDPRIFILSCNFFMVHFCKLRFFLVEFISFDISLGLFACLKLSLPRARLAWWVKMTPSVVENVIIFVVVWYEWLNGMKSYLCIFFNALGLP